MKHALLAATAALALMAATPAFAQNANSSTATTVTNGSTSGAAANVSGSPIGNGASSSNSQAGVQANTQSRSNAASQSGISTATTGASNAQGGSGYSGVGNTSASTGSTYAGVGNTTAHGGKSYAGVGNTSAQGGNVTVNTGGSGDPSSGSGDPSSGYGSSNYTGYGGGYTVRNVPEIVAPSIVGGNPCSVGVSAGVAVAGFGITGGGTWADRACERRQQAALLFNIGEKPASIALLCQDEHVAAAMATAGTGCPGTTAPPVARATQAPSAPVLAAAAPAPAIVPPEPVIPDWCGTVSGPERARYAAQCHFIVPVLIDQPTHEHTSRHVAQKVAFAK